MPNHRFFTRLCAGAALAALFLTGCSASDLNALLASAGQKNTLAIPKDATNVSFLEGTWHSVDDIRSTHGGQPVEQVYEFNRFGSGNVFIREPGETCSGRALARMNNQVLEIDIVNVTCPRGDIYTDAKLTCRQELLHGTVCTVTHSTGETFQVTLERM